MNKTVFDKYLIALWILTAAALAVFVGHYQNILIDFGREVYYPVQILQGKVLYKDLFNIYGPFSYMFNAVLYKIFGAKLPTLYGIGAICSLLTVTATYLISKRFLSRFLSFCIGVLTIAVGVATPVIFNFSFPYSWGMLYGIVSFLFAVLFLLKSEEKPAFIYLSAFLAGIAAVSKYEFAAFGLFILIYAFVKSFKTGIKALGSFLITPVITFGTLFLQGLTVSDLTNTFKIIGDMAKSNSLKYFYQNVGVYFHTKSIPFSFINFVKTAIGLGYLLYGFSVYKNNKIVLPLASVLAIFLIYISDRVVFFFLPVLLVIFAAASWKKLKENKALLLLVISAIIVSLKSFWGLIFLSYGSYYAGILLIAFFALLFSYLPEKYEKISGAYILVLAAVLMIINVRIYMNANTKIDGQYLYTIAPIAKSTNELITYLDKNTKDTDRVVIFPEGLMVNFLTKRNSDGWYNSLIPLYTEVFGEDNIKKHFTETKPDVIVFNNLIVNDYGAIYMNICMDYAQDFCMYTADNYKTHKLINNGFVYSVYKK